MTDRPMHPFHHTIAINTFNQFKMIENMHKIDEGNALRAFDTISNSCQGEFCELR